jgi:hypothetical protein
MRSRPIDADGSDTDANITATSVTSDTPSGQTSQGFLPFFPWVFWGEIWDSVFYCDSYWFAIHCNEQMLTYQ